MQVKQDHYRATRRRQLANQLRQTLNQFTRKLFILARRQSCQSGFVANLVVPTTLAMQVSKRLSRSNLVRPGAERLRLSQPTQLAINSDEDFLKNVFSPMLIFHEADDVSEQRLLNTLEEFVQSL